MSSLDYPSSKRHKPCQLMTFQHILLQHDRRLAWRWQTAKANIIFYSEIYYIIFAIEKQALDKVILALAWFGLIQPLCQLGRLRLVIPLAL